MRRSDPTETAIITTRRTRPRVSANRTVRQRRPWRTRLPSVGDVQGALGRAARRMAPLLILLAACALLTALVVNGSHWLRTSPRFAISELAITGNARVTRAQILDALDRAGIAPGANVFGVSPAAVERLLERDPRIASVRARRVLPDRITIEITERQPVAIALVDGTPYLVEGNGRPFKRARLDTGEADGLLVISGIGRKVWGADPDAAAALIRDALAVTATYQRNQDRPAIGELHVDRNGTTLYTLEGAVGVRLGAARGPELDARLARLDVIWTALSTEERAAARTIHLDSVARPDRVTVGMAVEHDQNDQNVHNDHSALER